MNDIFDNTNDLQYIELSPEELMEHARIFTLGYFNSWDSYPDFYDNIDVDGIYLGNIVEDGMLDVAVEHSRLNNSIIRWCVERGLDYVCLGEFSTVEIVDYDDELVEWYPPEWDDWLAPDLGYVSGDGNSR